MKHKSVFGFWGMVLEKVYAFGMHKRAAGSQTEACPQLDWGFTLHLNFLRGIAVIARPKLGR